MNAGRLGEVFRVEFAHNARRPLFWMLIAIVGFFAFLMPSGEATISSGNAAVGGTKAWITSEFAVTQLLILLMNILYAFFISVAAGMAVIRDQDLKIGELLHSSPLTPGEYVWGKFLAQYASFACVLFLHIGLMVFFNHVVPHPGKEIIGPFVLGNYLRPALLFGLPTILFYAGTSFAFGEWTRKPILVFVLPVIIVLAFALFLWDWSPSWLSPAVNRWLMWIDPAGLRWLSETWLKVDKGVGFYNSGRVGWDVPFAISRVAFALTGVALMVWTQMRFSAHLRGAKGRTKAGAKGAPTVAPTPAAIGTHAPLRTLAMRSGLPGFFGGALEMARVEMKELVSTPGLYLFVPIILLQTLGGNLVGVGAFDTPLLSTPGTLAATLLNTVTLLLCLLLLFYMTESLQREASVGLSSITYATPLRTPSLLFGKALANTFVGVVILLATGLGCALVLAVQGKVGFDLRPFLIVWGLLLIPTLLIWTTFVATTFAITGNRYSTYGLGLLALSVTGYFQLRNKMNWAFNWDLWNIGRWTDMGWLEMDRQALVLSRITAVGMALLFVALALRFFPRREQDATRFVHRLRPAALGRSLLGFAPFALLPLFTGITLWIQVENGMGGAAMKKKTRDYWKQNVNTWRDAPAPAMARVDLDVTLEPKKSFFKVNGSYRLVNLNDAPLEKIPVTGGFQWDSLSWTLNGAKYEPKNRSSLYEFTPPQPLAPGDSLTIGFRYQGRYPSGISKNGNRSMEFILPASAVLTGFDKPTFVPIVGFLEDIGIEDENRAEPHDYPDDYYLGRNKGFLPIAERKYPTHMKVTGPAEYLYNGTGIKVSETVTNGRRTEVWESDAPVYLFNLVAGRWAVKKGDGVELYYHPSHTYNIDEMYEALAGARKYYSEWFAPYPWKDLRLSEFPNLASYAMGSPTNITFSEGIGFLTKSEPKANAAFWVTAHESAHQWWPNLMMIAKGPGNDILAEGMSHYSTILLCEQVKGEQQRMAFCRQIETSYARDRRADSERTLLKVDESKPGDTPVVYDKAGFVFWMMDRQIGHENMLAGLREMMATYRDNPDHATVPDFLRVMRTHAPDPAAYDQFVDTWFHQIVVPEYKLVDAKRVKAGNGWDVHVKVRNDGSGKVPVSIAAVTGDRFDGKGKPVKGYRDARASTTIGKGESHDLVIHCDFQPESVVVDPDFTVLQLERRNATVKL